MIHNFEVKNYRGLKHLKLENLARVNLFAGKNNVGKTAVLEALSLQVSKVSLNMLVNHFIARGYINSSSKRYSKGLDQHFVFDDLDSIFNIENPSYLFIGSNISNLTIKPVFYNSDILVDGERVEKLVSSTDSNALSALQVAIEGESDFLLKRVISSAYLSSVISDAHCKFISKEINHNLAAYLFDEIALSAREDAVINGLNMVVPGIDRVAYTQSSADYRTPRIRLNKRATHLSEMGDGINRILFILLNLVNSENGYLFIDEIENGLHYTVQEKLWEIIFKLSKELNVQVFATTHSYDCIREFAEIANRTKEEDGKLIRLENRDGTIEAIAYDEEVMQSATENGIEVR